MDKTVVKIPCYYTKDDYIVLTLYNTKDKRLVPVLYSKQNTCHIYEGGTYELKKLKRFKEIMEEWKLDNRKIKQNCKKCKYRYKCWTGNYKIVDFRGK